MADTRSSLTAAELRAIGERIERDSDIFAPVGPIGHQACLDRASLHAAIERLVGPAGENCFAIVVPSRLLHMTKDAAIDAILRGGAE